MTHQLARTPSKDRDVRAFCGMLLKLNANRSELPEELLEGALKNEPLALNFSSFQGSVGKNLLAEWLG